jgi:hypothetical protein
MGKAIETPMGYVEALRKQIGEYSAHIQHLQLHLDKCLEEAQANGCSGEPWKSAAKYLNEHFGF